MVTPATSKDLLRQVVSAVQNQQSCTEAVAQLQAHADWDSLTTLKARRTQVEAWCAAIKPTLAKPVYQQAKRALRAAALPEADAIPELVKFKHAGVEIELEAERVLQRGGVLANYVGSFRETCFGTHRLRLGFHMTPEQLTGLANYISAGELSPYMTPLLRNELRDIGDRLGMDGLVEAAAAVLDPDALARRQTMRRNTLVDLGVQVGVTVDAAWEAAKEHLALPPPSALESVWPLSDWAPSPEALRMARATLATPNTEVVFSSRVETLPMQLGWLHKLASLRFGKQYGGTGFDSLPPSFTGLTSLHTLSLANTDLRVVPAMVLSLPSLTRLELAFMPALTHFEEFDPRGSKIAHVEVTELSASFTIPDTLFDLPALTSVKLAAAPLSLPAAVGQAQRLETLSWILSGTSALPRQIGLLSNLRTLQLKKNALTALPAEVRGLIGLRHLDASSNRLAQLPTEISALTSLEELTLTDNSLTALPAAMSNLGQLQRLHAKKNQLRALPDSIGGLTRLTQLDLADNQLDQLPAGLGQATQLRELNLTGNQFAAMPENLVLLAELRKLNLESNAIVALPHNLAALQLTSLNLAKNRIAELPAQGWWMMPALTHLNLTYNPMTALPVWLTRLTTLRQLTTHVEELWGVPRELYSMRGLNISCWENAASL